MPEFAAHTHDRIDEQSDPRDARIVERSVVLAFENADGAELLFDARARFHALFRIHGCLRFLFRLRRVIRGGAGENS